MYEQNNKMYGLVRQLGPWKPVEKDIFNFAAPAAADPSDFKVLAPDGTPNFTNTHAQYTQQGAGVTVIKTPYRTTIIERVIDDPRVHTPGRRLSVDRILGANRMPMEPGTSIRAGRGAISGTMTPMPMQAITEEQPKQPAATPYTMPDASKPAPPLTSEQVSNIIDDQNKTTSERQTGFGTYYDPSKLIEVWDKMTAAEKTIAKTALQEWAKMNAAQRVAEFSKPTSILRRIYTLYKGEQAAYYMSDVVGTLADILQFVSILV